MSQTIHQPLSITQVTSLGFLTALLSLFQPIPTVSAQQLTGLVTHETSGAGTQGRRIENLDQTLPYPTKFLEKKNAQTSTRKPHRLIRKPQNVPIASVEPSLAGSSPLKSLPPSLQSDNATAQSKEPSSLNSSVGAAAPLATMSVAPSPATAKRSIAAGTASTGTIPLAAAGAGNSSTSGSGSAGGRSMSRLAAEMPGLAQLISPPSAPVISVNPAVNPAIGASPTSFSFTAQAGTIPAAQTLSISNTGGGTLTWSASDNAQWLTLSSASGTGNGPVTLTVATGTLPAGTTSSGIISISAPGATPVTVPVSFTVTAAPVPPAIGMSPTSLSFTAQQGGSNPAAQMLTISNTGGSTLSWSASDTASWLTLNPGAGTGNGMLTASVSTNGLAAGTYNTTLTLAATGATNTPRTVPVILTVSAPTTSSATLSWNANTESDLAGYKVYRATATGAYGAPIATFQGSVTNYVATGLQSGATYFFVVTAYNSAGNESPRSNEVSKIF